MNVARFLRLLCVVLLCMAVFSSAYSFSRSASSVAPPAAQEFFAYLPTEVPTKDADPRVARPVGVGSVASGGSSVNLTVSLGDFNRRVDIYIGIYAREYDPGEIYLVTPQHGLQKLSDGLIAWRTDTLGNINNEALFPTIPAGALPLGIYEIFFVVTPSDGTPGPSGPPFYFWQTAFTIDSARSSEYVVFAWNDLGMHCLNPSYDQAVLLPPYNTVWAQVVKRGNPPQIVTSGLTVEYQILNNSFSYGKRLYGQFWDNVETLFGTALERDRGLNLSDPAIHNGLAGTMLAKGDHFQADGIPVTPVDDSGNWNPYQVAVVTVRNASGAIVAQTRATVPTSDEINCSKCHGSDPFNDMLQKHDTNQGTQLSQQKPVLCASCHGSPALGTSGRGSSGKYLSEAIHGFHATTGAACLDCHPGEVTRCMRSIAHTAPDGNCVACHGSMREVATSISVGSRIPWVNEPKCATCHGGIAGVDTADTLYRQAKGHGNVYCASCHGSPHAMVPTTQESDNYQSIRYQSRAKTIGSCAACHTSSRGLGASEFGEEHGGSDPEEQTACHTCHTAVSSNTANWPHAYQWRSRP